MQPNRSRHTDIEDKLGVTSGEREGRRGIPWEGVWEVQIIGCEIGARMDYTT